MLMINYNKLMKKLDDKGITLIRQKGYMPAFTMPATGHN